MYYAKLAFIFLLVSVINIFAKDSDGNKSRRGSTASVSKNINQIDKTTSLPTGTQTFMNATGSGSGVVTSVGGYFQVTAVRNGSAFNNIYADDLGAYLDNGYLKDDGSTCYMEVKAAGQLGSFEISTATIGTIDTYDGSSNDIRNIYVAGYSGGVLVAQTTPVNSVPGAPNTNLPINYSPLAGKRLDYFRIYYTIGTNTEQENFNFQDFTVANSSSISVTTNTATSVTSAGATLNGIVDANGTSTQASFEYGTTTSYGASAAATPGTLSSSTPTSVSAAITGLNPGTLYHFRAKGVSGGITTYGSDQTFTTLIAAPSGQASSVNLVSNSSGNQLTVSWTNGNGSKRAVFMKEYSGTITNPSDNTTYTASSDWNSKGSQLGTSGYYCIYNGTGNSITVTNTVSNSQYTVQVFEYNGPASSEVYNTSTALGNPSDLTTLAVELTSFTAAADDQSVILSWTTATEMNNSGFVIERKAAFESAQWEKAGFVSGNGTSNSAKHYSFTDGTPLSGTSLYRLKQVDNDGQYKYYDALTVTVGSPKEYKLMQNSPNPFNPSTAIKFQIPVSSFVTVKIYDQLGREVRSLLEEERQAGSHIVFWNGRDNNGSVVSSGMYLYKLTAGNFVETRKMNFIK